MNKTSGGDGIKVLSSLCQQIWKTQQCPQDWEKSVFIPNPKKGNVKERSNYRTFAVISHTYKVIFKILQARLQPCVTRELPDVQAEFIKTREPEIKLPISIGLLKKQENSRKQSPSPLLIMPKP